MVDFPSIFGRFGIDFLIGFASLFSAQARWRTRSFAALWIILTLMMTIKIVIAFKIFDPVAGPVLMGLDIGSTAPTLTGDPKLIKTLIFEKTN